MFSDGFTLEQWKKDNAEALNAIARYDAEVYYREEGLKEGIKEGIKQGLNEGKITAITETIKSMLKKNFTFEVISEITGKSEEEIKKIQKSMI